MVLRVFLSVLLLVGGWSGALADAAGGSEDFAEIQGRVTRFTLDNDMTFIVLERHQVPVVSFFTQANVGGVNETKGITGLAHLFEHMAFKGTTTIGTKDYAREQQALERLDQAYLALRAEQTKGAAADSARLTELQAAFQEAQAEANRYAVSDEFAQVIEQAGGRGLNAFTSNDQTGYFFSLPSNKIELWFSLESDRFLNPVLRDFYKERNVVMEERRMRTESQPQGLLFEEFLAIAFKAHPYGEPVVGHMSDLQALTRAEAERFFKTYYTPNNLTVAIVGDADPQQVRRLAEAYFGRIPKGPEPPPVETVEPAQRGERRVTLELQSQRVILIGYHRPSINHSDNAVYDAISNILSDGRTARLYRSLVRDQKIATFAGGFNRFPDAKYPHLFAFFAYPAPGHTNQEVEQAINAEIERLKTEPVDATTLQKVKTRARASLLRQLNSNFGLSFQLAYYQAVTGDWRNLFKRLDQINQVSADDILRVANACFQKSNRTVGTIEPMEAAAPGAGREKTR